MAMCGADFFKSANSVTRREIRADWVLTNRNVKLERLTILGTC